MEVLHSLEQHNGETDDLSNRTATTVTSSSQLERNDSLCSQTSVISDLSYSSCSDNKPLMIDLETFNVLLRLGAKQEDINAFTQTDINKYTAHKEILKTI